MMLSTSTIVVLFQQRVALICPFFRLSAFMAFEFCRAVIFTRLASMDKIKTLRCDQSGATSAGVDQSARCPSNFLESSLLLPSVRLGCVISWLVWFPP